MEIQSQTHHQESLVPKERQLDGQIFFEPGVHSDGTELRQFYSKGVGDIDTFAWNSEVARRMSEYQPSIVAVDGSYPNSLHLDLDSLGDYPISAKRWVWMGLPARPSEINNKGELIVVAGDVSYTNIKYEIEDSASIEERLDISRFTSNEGERRQIFEKNEATREVVATAALLSLANIALWYEGNRANSQSPLISRRSFIKGMGVALLAGGMLAKLSPQLAAYAPNTKTENFLEQIMDIAKNRFSDETQLDGRTALLISKSRAAIEQGLTPPDAKASVLMGNSHGFKAQDFLESAKERKKAIHDYANLLTEYLRDVSDRFPKFSFERTQKIMLDMLATGDLLVARDPDESLESLDKMVDGSVQYIGSFVSPEVLEATEDLRS